MVKLGTVCIIHFITTEPTNCRKGSTKPEYYYLNNNSNTYYPCYNTCLTCSKDGNSQNHNCDECKTNYFFIETEPYNCITESEKPLHFYLDANVPKTYRKCYETCDACLFGGNYSNHNCTSCKKGYYNLENTSQCVNNKTKPYVGKQESM